MTLQTRRTLFYALLAIFLIAGAGLIFYSSGWRLDPETLRVNKIGGLFVETGTPDASIKVGRKVTPEANSLLNKGTFINGLFPKYYTIEVFKDGYQSWKKTLEIKPSLVTKTLPIVLIPQKPIQELVAKNVKNFWLGPDGIIARLNNFNQLFINDKPTLGSRVLEWPPKGNVLLTYDSASGIYFLIDSEKNNSALNLNLALRGLLAERLLKVKLDPRDKNKIVLLTTRGLYAFDTAKLNLIKIFKQPVGYLFAFGDDLVWTSNNTLHSLYQTVPQKGPLNDVLSKELFINQNSNFLLSPDNQKIASFEENDAYRFAIHFLQDNESLNKTAGDKVRINYLSDQPSDFSWDQTSSYLFIQYPSGLYFGEIDSRDSVNLQLVTNDLEKYQYDSINNTLYILFSENLYKIKF